MNNTNLNTSKDPVPYILNGFTPEQKLEIFLYASEQYWDAIPKAKSDGIKRLLQHHLEFCAEFVDIISEFISSGYNGNPDFDRLKQIHDETTLEGLGYSMICRKYPIEERKLVENTTGKIADFAANMAKNLK